MYKISIPLSIADLENEKKKESWELLKRADGAKAQESLKNNEEINKNSQLNITDYIDEMTVKCLSLLTAPKNCQKNVESQINNYINGQETFSLNYDSRN